MTGVFQPDWHTGNRIGNYLLSNNQLSITLQAASGDLFNVGSNRILNGDTSEASTYQRPLYIPRNSVRGPAIFELNARYTRLFPIREKMNAQFIAESTNVSNTLNVTALNTTAQVNPQGMILVPNTNAATGARDQRLIQLGVRFNF